MPFLGTLLQRPCRLLALSCSVSPRARSQFTEVMSRRAVLTADGTRVTDSSRPQTRVLAVFNQGLPLARCFTNLFYGSASTITLKGPTFKSFLSKQNVTRL